MLLTTAIKDRRSVRHFTDDLISKEDFNKIIDLARYAPSWKNSQTSRYTLIQNKELLADIAQNALLDFAYNTKTISHASNLVILSTIVGVSGYEKDGSFSTSKNSEWQTFDAGISCQTFCLAAYGYNYGTVVLGIFDDEKIAKIIDLPADQKVSAIIVIGVGSNPAPAGPPRKDVNELVCFK
ncbi:nitroreductase [Erysipelotrichaceae bacterium]|nr:nitroreductase [Erysipelotrichaceae bacterium]